MDFVKTFFANVQKRLRESRERLETCVQKEKRLKASANEGTLFPECFLDAQTRKLLLREQNVSEQLLSQQMFPAAENGETFASAIMFSQHCFLVCGRL